MVFVLGHKLNESDGPDTQSTGRDTIFNCGDKQLATQLFAAFQTARESGKFGGYPWAPTPLERIPDQGRKRSAYLAGERR